MLGIVAGVVISMLKQVDLTSTRNLAVIGSSLMVGLVVPLWVKKYPGDIDTGKYHIGNSSPICYMNSATFSHFLIDISYCGTLW